MERDPRTKARTALHKARFYNWVCRVVRWSLLVHFTSVAVILAFFGVATWVGEGYGDVIGMSAVGCAILSGIVFLVAMTLREMLLFGWTGWHFSVRSLLLLTTWISVVLGGIVWAVR